MILGVAVISAGNRVVAPLFYAANIGMAVFAGIIVLIPGMPLLAITLNANLLATILMPAALVFAN